MATDLLKPCRATRGSFAVVIYGQELRTKAHIPLRRYLFDTDYDSAYEDDFAPPIQSSGQSQGSRCIEDYLDSALAGYSGLVSNPPKQIRMTSSPSTRAAAMDPWDIKNRRRIRLLDKKFSVGLNVREEAELIKLKRDVYEHVQAIAPRLPENPVEIDARFDRMKRRIAAKREKKD